MLKSRLPTTQIHWGFSSHDPKRWKFHWFSIFFSRYFQCAVWHIENSERGGEPLLRSWTNRYHEGAPSPMQQGAAYDKQMNMSTINFLKTPWTLMGQISSLQVTWQFKNLQDRDICNLFKIMMWFVKIPAGIAKNLFNIAKVQRFQ